MKYTIIIFCGLLLTGNTILAHTYDHLKIEELKLLVREQEQKLEHKDKVIDTQKKLILFLEHKLEHYKHELSKEKAYTAFKELLKSLGF